jgi:hypothetical protein
MTITYAGAPRYLWSCLSSDTKPTNSRVGVNDILLVTDTSAYYIWNGTAWNLYPLGTSGGGGGTAPSFTNSVTDASPGASANNYSPTGYSGGVTNRLLVNAAPTTLTGLVAATDGWALYLRNTSTTNVLTLAHLSGSSSAANQFSCPQGVNATLAPLTGAQLIYVTNVWTFS